MAVEYLELIKLIQFPVQEEVVEGQSWFVITGPDGIGRRISEENMRLFFSYFNAGFMGSATTSTDPDTSLGSQVYIAAQTGTYSNMGGLEVDIEDGLNLLIYNGSTWSKSVVPIDLSGYATAEALETVHGEIGSAINLLEKIATEGNQIFNKNDVTYGIYDNSGNRQPSVNSISTPKIKISEGETNISISHNDTLASGFDAKVLFFDSYGVFISYINKSTTDLVDLDIPEDAEYFAINIASIIGGVGEATDNTYVNRLMVNYGAEILPLEPYAIHLTESILAPVYNLIGEKEVELNSNISTVINSMRDGGPIPIIYGDLEYRSYSSNGSYVTSASQITQSDSGTYNTFSSSAGTRVIYFRTGFIGGEGLNISISFRLNSGSVGVGLGFESKSTSDYKAFLLASASGNLYTVSPFTVNVIESDVSAYTSDDDMELMFFVENGVQKVSIYKNTSLISTHVLPELISGELSIAMRSTASVSIEVDKLQVSAAPTLASVAYVQEAMKSQLTITPFANYPLPKKPESLKILAIGNSFSIDTMHFVPTINSTVGIDNVKLSMMVIAGGSLQDHHTNYFANSDVYTQHNSQAGTTTWQTQNNRTLIQAIESDDWDLITFQQGSTWSGVYPTVEPYLNDLIAEVKKRCPNPGVTIGWNSTWAFASNTTRPGWSEYYDSDQDTMYEAIMTVARNVMRDSGIDLIIPTGTTIQNLRNSGFDSSPNEMTRDTYHIDYGAGRYACACAFFQSVISPVFGKSIRLDTTFTTSEGNLPVTSGNRSEIQDAAIQATVSRFTTAS